MGGSLKRPAIQLYFGDLMKNPKVRRCGWGARGVLVWTMALLHDSDEYGALRWPLAEIVQAVGCPIVLMRELVDKGALKGSDSHVAAYRWAPSHAGKRGREITLVEEQDGPLWFSSRMIRDEYKRTNRGLTTRFKSAAQLSTTPQKAPTTPPRSTPTRGHGDGGGEPNAPPTRGLGYGASSSIAYTSIGLPEPPTNAHAREAEPEKRGDIRPKRPPRSSNGAWRHDDAAAERKAAELGITPNPGEGYGGLRDRIERALERAPK